jgi:hypothetical protein
MKFRFVFSENLKKELELFATEVATNTRQEIKSAWNKWVETHYELIVLETARLEKEGFMGGECELVDKLFFSVKYYHIKRILQTLSVHKKEDPLQKEQKIKISKSIILDIDAHIAAAVGAATAATLPPPNDCFLEFMIHYKENVYNELLRLHTKAPPNLIFDKIKKSFRNRYYAARA